MMSRVLFLNECKRGWHEYQDRKTNWRKYKKTERKSRFYARLCSSAMQLKGCDITRSAVAKIEVGQRHLYPDEIILLKEILGASYDEIFCV